MNSQKGDVKMMQVYLQRKQQALKVLLDVEKFGEEVGSPAVNEVRRYMQELKEDQFTVVVVGQWNFGKSTLINALIGEELLPVEPTPTTTIITEIQYGNGVDRTLTGVFADRDPEFFRGDASEIRQRLQQYMTFQDIEPANIPWIALVTYPLAFCGRGVRIVDTPGVEDLNLSRAEITEGYLPKADAVILVLDETQPFSDKDELFLREQILGRGLQNIFFVLNKIDLRPKPQELTDAINRTNQKLRSILGSVPIELFPVSAKLALVARTCLESSAGVRREEVEIKSRWEAACREDRALRLYSGSQEALATSRIEVFQEALESYLSGSERATDAIRSKLRKAKSDLDSSVIPPLQQRVQLLQSDVTLQQLDARIQQTQDDLTRLQNEINQISSNIAQRMGKLQTELIPPDLDKIPGFSKALETLDRYIDDHDLKELKYSLPPRVDLELNRLWQPVFGKVMDGFIQVQNQTIRECQQAVRQAVESVSVQVGVELSIPEVSFESAIKPWMGWTGGGVTGGVIGAAISPAFAALGLSVSWWLGPLGAAAGLALGASLGKYIAGKQSRHDLKSRVRGTLLEVCAQAREDMQIRTEQFKKQLTKSTTAYLTVQNDGIEAMLTQLRGDKARSESDRQVQAQTLQELIHKGETLGKEIDALLISWGMIAAG